ncbi:MAG: hypothetical protein R2728_01470 [Chitinophagales bacterium]
MDNQYKVEFLSSVEETKWLNKPMDELDLKFQLEALLIERYKQGYKLFQIIETKRVNPTNNKNISGLLVVFEKIKE